MNDDAPALIAFLFHLGYEFLPPAGMDELLSRVERTQSLAALRDVSPPTMDAAERLAATLLTMEHDEPASELAADLETPEADPGPDRPGVGEREDEREGAEVGERPDYS